MPNLPRPDFSCFNNDDNQNSNNNNNNIVNIINSQNYSSPTPSILLQPPAIQPISHTFLPFFPVNNPGAARVLNFQGDSNSSPVSTPPGSPLSH